MLSELVGGQFRALHSNGFECVRALIRFIEEMSTDSSVTSDQCRNSGKNMGSGYGCLGPVLVLPNNKIRCPGKLLNGVNFRVVFFF